MFNSGDYNYGDDPSAYNAGPDQFSQGLDALYQKYYNRPANPGELASHRGNPGGLPAIEAMLQASQPAATSPTQTAPAGDANYGQSNLQPYTPPASFGGPATPTQFAGNPNPGFGGTPYDTGPKGNDLSPKPTTTAPTYPGGTFSPPSYEKPPAFSYADFSAPDPSQVFNDPSYKFRFGEGMQTITNNRAASGTLGTGGTLKDFINYGQNAASNEYQNVWGRAKDAYLINRSGALDAYNTNYQTQYKDPYQISYLGASDAFGSQQHAADQNFAAGQHATDQQMYYDTHAKDQKQMYDWNKFLSDYSMWRNNKLDDFDQRFRVATA